MTAKLNFSTRVAGSGDPAGDTNKMAAAIDSTIDDVAGKVATNDARLSDARTPLSHTHAISQVTGLQTALDATNSQVSDLQTKALRDKGFYATSSALIAANPTGVAGDKAIVGATDTLWVWDVEGAAWKDSGAAGSSAPAANSITEAQLVPTVRAKLRADDEWLGVPQFGFDGNLSSSSAGWTLLSQEPLKRGLLTTLQTYAPAAGTGYMLVARRLGATYRLLAKAPYTATEAGMVTVALDPPLRVTELDVLGAYAPPGSAALVQMVPRLTRPDGVRARVLVNGELTTTEYTSVGNAQQFAPRIRAIITPDKATADATRTYYLNADFTRTGEIPFGWTANDNGYTLTDNGALLTGSNGSGFYYEAGFTGYISSAYRTTRVVLELHTNTVLQLRWKPVFENPAGTKGTIVEVNATTGKLKLYNAWDGSDTPPTVLLEVTIPAIVDNRLYAIEVERVGRRHKARLIDTTTNAITELVGPVPVDNYAGFMAGGSANQSFVLHFDGSPLLLKQAQAWVTAVRPKAYVVGDSITDEVGANPGTSFGELLRTRLGAGQVVISGRGGGTILGVMQRIETEAHLLRPEYIVVTIGTNNYGEFTLPNLIALVDLILLVGAKPVINCIPTLDSNAQATVNNLILSLGLPGARFDIATAINGNPSAGRDTSKFFDELHPNAAGHQAMYNRLLADVPQLLD